MFAAIATAAVTLIVLAILARYIEPFCPECQHCRDEKRRYEEQQKRLRREWETRHGMRRPGDDD